MQLSEGALLEILNGGTPQKPVFQILLLRKIHGGADPRYRFSLSDGMHFCVNVIASSKLSRLVDKKPPETSSFLTANEYQIHVASKKDTDKPVLILEDATFHEVKDGMFYCC